MTTTTGSRKYMPPARAPERSSAGMSPRRSPARWPASSFAVDDIDIVRADLASREVEVSEALHKVSGGPVEQAVADVPSEA